MEIHRIHMGPFTNAFVARGDQGTLLVDSGFPNHENHFWRQIHRLGIRSRDIMVIVVTHGHADHVGSLQALKEQTSARVVIHRAESDLVRHGVVVVPPPVTAWGRFLCLLFRAFSFLGQFDPVEPDIVVGGELSLGQFGIRGTIIPTPGHTPGSLSVVLESGEAFVGDLAVNALPMGLGLGIPALAENVSDIYTSWKRILSTGATTIYPAHGTPFPADKLRKKLLQISGRRSVVRDQRAVATAQRSAAGRTPRDKDEINPRGSLTMRFKVLPHS